MLSIEMERGGWAVGVNGSQRRHGRLTVSVYGQCRRSVSAVSVYATYATCATLCSPFPLYPVLHSCYGRLLFSILDIGGATFILPFTLPANAKGAHRPRKNPAVSIQCL